MIDITIFCQLCIYNFLALNSHPTYAMVRQWRCVSFSHKWKQEMEILREIQVRIENMCVHLYLTYFIPIKLSQRTKPSLSTMSCTSKAHPQRTISKLHSSSLPVLNPVHCFSPNPEKKRLFASSSR